MKNLSEKDLKILFYDEGTHRIETAKGNIYNAKFEGVNTNLARRFKETNSDYIQSEIGEYIERENVSYLYGS